MPPIEGIEDIEWIDHVSALELTELPESLLVVGGGPVGLEFGQIFARFGSRVTIVQGADRIAPRSDPQSSSELQAALEAEGVAIELASFVKSVTRVADGIVATIVPREGEGSKEVRVTHVLLASGRVSNIEGLNVEKVGIETHRPGIVVDEHMRTSVEGIWAAGDVTGLYQLTPIAQYEARIAIDDMFGGDAPAADYSVLPTVIFTHPELAGVGLTEEEGTGCESVVHDIKYVQRSSYKDEKYGLYKIVFESDSRRVVGLHVVAPDAGDVVQGFSLALKLGATVDDFAGMHHAFPTFGEGVKAAAEKAVPQLAPMVEIDV
jgi:mercuric reductase